MSQHEVALQETNGVATDLVPPANATPAKKAKGANTRNPTVVAIARISSILDDIADAPTRKLVATFIAEQYC